MPYSTVTEVRLVLQGFVEAGPGSDPDITSALLSDAQIEYSISSADEEINSVLRRRYALPLPAPIPVIIKNLSIEIAAAQADLIFRGSREYANELSPSRIRYERAKELLERIATGDYPLYNVGEGPEEVGDTSLVINPSPSDDDFILVTDVFPRGLPDSEDAEFSETTLIPYRPYLMR